MVPSQRAASRRVFVLLAAVLAAGIFVIFGRAQAPTPQPQHVIVKINPSLAKVVESALPMQTMELLAGSSGNARIEAFLSKYAAHKLRPVYPNIVRSKKLNGFTDLQIATAIQRKFAKRASRLHASFRPPEISRTYVLEFDPAARPNLQGTLKSLSADADVEFAEQDHLASVNFTPNDPYFLSSGTWGQAYDDLWGIKKIGAPAAWDTTAGAGVIVAVVDTGLDYNHPDIAANVWTNPGEIPNNGIDDDNNGYIDDVRGWDFIGSTYVNPTQSNNPIDHFGHGTHVAGTIAAVGNNGIGVIGVAWQAKVMAVKGLDDSGTGLDSTLGPAIIYAANNGADVISNSWAGPGTSQTIADAVSYAYNLGAVIVAAAGNNSDDARNYFPANLPQVITVAASDHNDVQAYFSNWGDKIDVTAPGVDILSLRAAGTSMGTPVDSSYTRADGTSMATPHVSGLAALILAQYPAYSNEDVRQVIRVSATSLGTPGFDLNYGYGRINAAAAITVPDAVEAKILSPSDGTHINGPVSISGVARGSAFAQYKLEYGSGESPTTWTQIQSGTSPVSGGALGVFDPSSIPDGLYVIRLTAYDLSNNAFADRIELAVNYLSITSPAPPAVPVVASVYKPGAQVSVAGTATGATFQDFRIDWAEGIMPSTGWSNAGISLSGGGASPVTSGPLGTWDTTAISKADYYTIRLSVDDAAFSSTAFTLIYLEPNLLSQNWPIALDEGTYWSSGIVPAKDASGNQKLTLVGLGTTVPSEFKTFSPDGATQTNNPLTYFGSLFQPATGDLDGNPGDEAAMTDVLMFRVFRNDNTSYTLTPPQTMELSNSQVVLEDLNNDSQFEIIGFGEDYRVPNAYIYAYLRNGQPLNANFPITVANQNTNIDTYTKGNRLLVGDIDGDGNREILFLEGTTASTFTPRLFANDGSPRTWGATALNGYPDQMVLADLDHNGKLETVFTCSCNSRKELHVLQPDGSERTGWPVILGTYPYYLTFIAIGDLNRDGKDEIVVSNSNELVVLQNDGTPFSASWPIIGTGYTSFGPVVLADINGDGLPEILTSEYAVNTAPNPLFSGASVQATSVAQAVMPQLSTEITIDANGNKIMHPRADVGAQVNSQNLYNAPQIVAFNGGASVVRSWNMLGANGNQPFYMAKLTVGDFNNDGLTDIAATYWTTEGGGRGGWLKEGVATVLTTGTAYNPSANDWPMIYQNARNTAVYRPLLNVSVTAPSAGAFVSGVIALAANAPDKIATPAVQFQIDGANVGGLIASAPYTTNWDTTTVSPGTHIITALASDSAGNTAVAPPVTVTVTVLSATPGSLNLGSALIGSTTAAQSVTLTNAAQNAYSLASINVTGDFAETDNCVGSVAPGGTCTINVAFTPTMRGIETGSLSFSGNFPGPLPTVSLTGTGQALAASVSPSSLTFQPLLINSTSSAQTITYSNTGDVAVSISSIVASGDFAQTNTCGSSLAVGASCSIGVTFTPTVRGTRTGSIAVSGGVNASATLSGTGQAMLVNISPSTLPFANQLAGTTSAAQTVTLSNTGDFPFSVTGLSYAGPFTVIAHQLGNVAPGTAFTFSATFTPSGSGPYQANLTINGTFPNAPATIPMTGTGYTLSAAFSPSAFTFAAQRAGTSSTAQTFTLANTGSGMLSVTGFSISGDFTQSNNCPASLAAGANCSVSVIFNPTARGARTGSLTLNSNATGTPPTVSLSGTGVAPIASLTPTSLAFGNQFVGVTSAAQTIVLANTGDATLNFSSILASGDFAQSNTCGTALAPNANCNISVTFTPTTAGSRPGTLSIADDSLSGSPQTAPLSGTGGVPALSFSPATFSSFGNQRVNTTSAAQAMNITNTGNVSLSITNFTITAGFNQTNTCGSTLAAGASCSVSVTFAPTAQGALSGTLTLNSNFPGTTPSFALNGTGTAPIATLSASSLTFGAQLVGTASAAQPVTLTNSGTASLNISSITSNFDFSQTNNCPPSLAASANCTINVTFAPSASGTRSGIVSIADDAANGNPQTISLSGSGYTLSATFNPSSLTFGSQRVGTTSSSQNVSLINTGTGTLSIGGFLMSGDLAQSNNCPSSLASGATCTVSVVFAPSARGTRTGSLTLNSNATGTPPSVSLSGTGIAPVASLSPTSLTFAGQNVSTTSAAQKVTLGNTGDATLDLASIVASGDFAQTNNCASTLAAGANCTINVTFTPTAGGTRTGVLTVTDDAFNGSAQSASVSGTGLDFSLSASPASVSVNPGSSANYTVTVSAVGGSYSSSVSLACSSTLPKGVNCSFSPSGVTPGSSSANSTLKISTAKGGNGAPSGSYVITIRGASGADQHTTTVTLVVN